jgi:hypothetical protein
MATTGTTRRAARGASMRVYLPPLILLGYIAFLITGFGTRLSALQPVPIYIFFSLLLLTLQLSVSENRTPARVLYVLITSGFALTYAGERVFNSAQNFTRSPYTYIIINALLLIVFLYDAIDRRRAKPRGLDHAVSAQTQSGDTSGAAAGDEPRPISQLSYGAWATDFAGLASIFFIAAFLLDLLGPQALFQRLGLPHIGNGQPYVVVDLNTALPVHLSAPINLLQNLDLVIALFATAISLLLLVIVGALVIPEPHEETGGAPTERSVGFGRSLGAILKVALKQVSLSMRLVLGPLVWLIPAFSIALFAQQVTEFLRFSARFSGSSLLDLFNPFSQTSLAHIQQGFAAIGLGVLAIAMVIFAVVVVEQNGRLILRALSIIEETGRVVALTWAFFLYSLAMLNAVVVLGGFTKVEPFQVGAPGIIALLIGTGFAIVPPRRGRAKTPSAPVAAPAVPPTIKRG